MLENRLDKVMIKLNETLGIKKTYAVIHKKLKEERVNFDSTLEDIENSLKGKEHNLEQLLAMNSDAVQAREQAEIELRKYHY